MMLPAGMSLLNNAAGGASISYVPLGGIAHAGW